jgi:hypothetical protein
MRHAAALAHIQMEVLPMLSLTKTALAVLPLGLVSLLHTPPSVDRAGFSGTHTFTMVQPQQLEFGDAPGHVLMLAQARGANESPGPDGFMDGAEILSVSVADLVAGNGSHHGYDVQVGDGDSVFTQWGGVVSTVLSPEKTPQTSFHGTWTKNRGTGRYLGIKGEGTYQGHFTSPTAYVVEWRGEITVPKGRVAKR